MARTNLTTKFECLFRSLLAGENLAHFEQDLSGLFEVIATRLLAGVGNRNECYFDGVSGMTVVSTSTRRLDVNGEMWVGRNRSQWTESFRATVVDKNSTKRGIWITVWIGEDRAEGEIASILRESPNFLTSLP
jgi:hypothetical protein